MVNFISANSAVQIVDYHKNVSAIFYFFHSVHFMSLQNIYNKEI